MTLPPLTVSADGPAGVFSAHVAEDALVLANRERRTDAGGGPRFADDVWDLSIAYHAPNANRGGLRARFDRITDPVWRLTAKEYAYARLNHSVDGGRGLPSVATVAREIRALRELFAHLSEHHPGLRLADLDDDTILDGFLTAVTAGSSARWRPHERARYAWMLTLLHRLGDHLTHDRLVHAPFRGRSAHQVAGRRDHAENITPRIPPQVLAPYLRGALFYVQVAAGDILAALDERTRLTAGRGTQRGSAVDRLDRFVEQRRAAGRGVPAMPARVAWRWEADRANVTLIARLSGMATQTLRKSPALRSRLERAVTELGLEPGGMDTPISLDPDTGAPWRDRFDLPEINDECRYLMTAAYAVTAYLSGMRDSEVQSLRRGCHFTEPTSDGVLVRHKVRSTVYKGRQPTGEQDTWVVLEPVAEAIAVLERLGDSEFLFTRVSHRGRQPLVAHDINQRLNELRDYLNRIRPHDPIPDVDGVPWRLTTRQFRRTVAWHIAHQPFGAVAGKIQYKHVRIALFEGYAGTSASGFPAEVEAEREFARQESFLEQYEDYKAGVPTPARLVEQFDQVRAELGDFPGRVVDTARLRAMLANAARTYHPGVLNDCYFDPAAALCLRGHQRAGSAPGRPVTNHCQPALCANSCVTARHTPAIRQVIDDARTLLTIQRLSPVQRTALRDQIATMQALLPAERRS